MVTMARAANLLFASLALLSAGVFAQDKKYSGPTPSKPDIPCLLHADNLVETESGEAKEEKRKDATAYVTPGAASPARTPMAEPILLLLAEKLQPQRLSLYRLEVKGGSREILFPLPGKKKPQPPRPYRFLITKLDESLYKIEANETLENGEYCLSPNDSNQVFCFEVY